MLSSMMACVPKCDMPADVTQGEMSGQPREAVHTGQHDNITDSRQGIYGAHVVCFRSIGEVGAGAGEGALPNATRRRSISCSSLCKTPICFQTPGFAACGMNLCNSRMMSYQPRHFPQDNACST